MTVATPSDSRDFVTVSEMASLCGLSRQRFHELIGTVFPFPVYLVSNRRPIYDRKLQEKCLQVRQTGRSILGEPVLFYRRRSSSPSSKKRPVTPKPATNHSALIRSLESLGLTHVDEKRVDRALQELFPTGTNNLDEGEIIRQVFLKLKFQKDV